MLVALWLAAAPAQAAPPPVWETDFGTELSISDDDDQTTEGEGPGIDVPFSFPFPGYGQVNEGDILDVSSNGFIELAGNDIDSGCCSGDVTSFLENDFPIVSLFWTDVDPEEGGAVYYNEFDDDGDGQLDRFVITFDSSFHECDDLGEDTDGDGVTDDDEELECHLRAQATFFRDGRIVFGYDRVDLVGELSNSETDDDLLVGVTRGGGATDPGSRDFSTATPFDTGDSPTAYELFESNGAPPPFDLDQQNICFTPNGNGGWQVSRDCAPAQQPQQQPEPQQPPQQQAVVPQEPAQQASNECGLISEGTSGADTLEGSEVADVLHAYAGADVVVGNAAADCLFGGRDGDNVSGNAGEDRIYGQRGDDRLVGHEQDDGIKGGSGDDVVYGDLQGGDTGNDRIYGGRGEDTLLGRQGRDYITGGRDDDRLTGGSEFDRLFGRKGDDVIVADDGERDRIRCGAGDDTVHADPEDNVKGCENVER